MGHFYAASVSTAVHGCPVVKLNPNPRRSSGVDTPRACPGVPVRRPKWAADYSVTALLSETCGSTTNKTKDVVTSYLCKSERTWSPETHSPRSCLALPCRDRCPHAGSVGLAHLKFLTSEDTRRISEVLPKERYCFSDPQKHRVKICFFNVFIPTVRCSHKGNGSLVWMRSAGSKFKIYAN